MFSLWDFLKISVYVDDSYWQFMVCLIYAYIRVRYLLLSSCLGEEYLPFSPQLSSFCCGTVGEIGPFTGRWGAILAPAFREVHVPASALRHFIWSFVICRSIHATYPAVHFHFSCSCFRFVVHFSVCVEGNAICPLPSTFIKSYRGLTWMVAPENVGDYGFLLFLMPLALGHGRWRGNGMGRNMDALSFSTFSLWNFSPPRLCLWYYCTWFWASTRDLVCFTHAWKSPMHVSLEQDVYFPCAVSGINMKTDTCARRALLCWVIPIKYTVFLAFLLWA